MTEPDLDAVSLQQLIVVQLNDCFRLLRSGNNEPVLSRLRLAASSLFSDAPLSDRLLIRCICTIQFDSLDLTPDDAAIVQLRLRRVEALARVMSESGPWVTPEALAGLVTVSPWDSEGHRSFVFECDPDRWSGANGLHDDVSTTGDGSSAKE